MGKHKITPQHKTNHANDEHEMKVEDARRLMYQIYSAIQSRDLSKAIDLIASLGVFNGAILSIGHYLEEMRKIRAEEEIQSKKVQFVRINERYYDDTGLFSSVLKQYQAKKDKIHEMIASALFQVAYYAGIAKQQDKRCNALYYNLVTEYKSKPKVLDLNQRIVDIKLIRMKSGDSAIKSLTKESQALVKQAEKLEKLRKKLEDKFLSDKIASPTIRQDAERFIAQITKEIKEVRLLITAVNSYVKDLEKSKVASKARDSIPMLKALFSRAKKSPGLSI
jgi:hypothetical protein